MRRRHRDRPRAGPPAGLGNLDNRSRCRSADLTGRGAPFPAPRDADDAATVKPRNLTGQRANCPCRRAHHDGLARPRIADLEHGEVRGDTRHAQNSKRCRHWRKRRIHARDAAGIVRLLRLAPGQGVRLPAQHALRNITFAPAGVPRAHDLAHHAAPDGLADGDGPAVVCRLVHAPALQRVCRQVAGGDEELPGRGLGHASLHEREIARPGQPGRPCRQYDATVHANSFSRGVKSLSRS